MGTFFGLTGIAIEASHALHLIQALFPLGNAAYLKAFSAEQLYAMVTLSMKPHGNGFGIALFVFGPAFLVRGYLMFRSGYSPKILGVLYQFADLAYRTASVPFSPLISRHSVVVRRSGRHGKDFAFKVLVPNGRHLFDCEVFVDGVAPPCFLHRFHLRSSQVLTDGVNQRAESS